MLENFQLAVIVRQGAKSRIFRVPMHQALQRQLAEAWHGQLDSFLADIKEIPFNAGYSPEENECFALRKFNLPDSIAGETSLSAGDLSTITDNEGLLSTVRGVVGFARQAGAELVLFQHFSRSHVIHPGSFLFLQNGTYETMDRPGLTLGSNLSAVYRAAEQKLLFRNFRVVNTFLPLADFYEEASEEQIRRVLGHEKLDAVNADTFAKESNQWYRKRFALLRDSGVLDKFSVKEIKARSNGYDVEIVVKKGKIVFPEDKRSAKKLLQFLNEELFRGAITNKLYETNSKRDAD